VAADLRAERPGTEAVVANGLEEMGPLVTAVIREGSRVAFTRSHWTFELSYFLLTRVAATQRLTVRLIYLVAWRRLLRFIRSHDADVVVSTYPGTTVALGEFRRRGLLQVPTVSVITDLAGLMFWAYPGIDLHTITHPESAAEVEEIVGPGRTRWARPPSSPDFLGPRSQADGRRALGLPEEGKIVVVSGGGWAVGDLTGAMRSALASEAALVVCLTGRNEEVHRRLEAEFGDHPRVRLMPFTDQMSDLLAAADALVHSSAGLTVLEAIIRGCPVISYGFGIGHVRVNNRAFARFGLARPAGSRRELDAALREVLRTRPAPDPGFAARPSVASLVLELCDARSNVSGGDRPQPAAPDLVQDPGQGGHRAAP
jgi:UDP-N-acetylglucosamine:LPS N-acetylglucosamine transferase